MEKKSYKQSKNLDEIIFENLDGLFPEQASDARDEAIEKFIAQNWVFVLSIANSYSNGVMSLLDKVSNGNIGLRKAITTFSPAKKVNFNSYAAHCITCSIIEGFNKNEKKYIAMLYKNNKKQWVKDRPTQCPFCNSTDIKEYFLKEFGPSHNPKNWYCNQCDAVFLKEDGPDAYAISSTSLPSELLAEDEWIRPFMNDMKEMPTQKRLILEMLLFQDITLKEVSKITSTKLHNIRDITKKALHELAIMMASKNT